MYQHAQLGVSISLHLWQIQVLDMNPVLKIQSVMLIISGYPSRENYVVIFTDQANIEERQWTEKSGYRVHFTFSMDLLALHPGNSQIVDKAVDRSCMFHRVFAILEICFQIYKQDSTSKALTQYSIPFELSAMPPFSLGVSWGGVCFFAGHLSFLNICWDYDQSR